MLQKAYAVIKLHVPLEIDFRDVDAVEAARQDLFDVFAPTAEKMDAVARIEILPDNTEANHA